MSSRLQGFWCEGFRRWKKKKVLKMEVDTRIEMKIGE